jgi:hypothetical protein
VFGLPVGLPLSSHAKFRAIFKVIHIGDNIKTQHEIEHEIGNFLSCLSNNFSPSFALATFCNTHTHKQSFAFDHTKVVTNKASTKKTSISNHTKICP